jgi:hypothetical protein
MCSTRTNGCDLLYYCFTCFTTALRASSDRSRCAALEQTAASRAQHLHLSWYPPLLHYCFTTALLALLLLQTNGCEPSATFTSHLVPSSASLLLYYCFTTALLALLLLQTNGCEPSATFTSQLVPSSALLLLYYCFTCFTTALNKRLRAERNIYISAGTLLCFTDALLKALLPLQY